VATGDDTELDPSVLQSIPPSGNDLAAAVAASQPTIPKSRTLDVKSLTRDAKPPPPPQKGKRTGSGESAVPGAGIWPSASVIVDTEPSPAPWVLENERLVREIEARTARHPLRAALLLATRARILNDAMNEPGIAADALTRASELAPDARFVAASKRWLAEKSDDAQAMLQATRAELAHVGEGRERTALLWQVAAIEEHITGDLPGATRTMRELLELDPNDLGALEALGALHLHVKPRDEAVFAGVVEALERMAGGTEDAITRSALQGAVGALRDRYLTDVDAALAWLRRALETDPSNAGAQATLEAVLLRRHAWDEYARSIMALAGRTAEPIPARELFERAGDIYADCIHDLGHAAQCFDRAATLAESDPGPVEKLVRVLESAGRWEETADACRRLLARTSDPVQRAWTLVRLGQLYETRLQRADDALATYRQAVEAHPAFAPAVQELLRMCRERGMPLAIELERREADRIVDPTVRAVRYASLAEAVEIAGERDKKAAGISKEAGELYERTLALDPMNAAAFEALDRAYRAANAWGELIALYESAIASGVQGGSHPRHLRSLRLQLAEVLHSRSRQPARAVQLRREALKGPEDRFDTLVSLARALADAGDWSGYVEVLEEQVGMLDGTSAIATIYRAASTLELRVKDTQRALAMYEKLLERSPRHEAAARAISRIHEKEGRWERVIAAERKLLDLATRPEDILEGLIRIAKIAEEQLGRGEDAIGAYLEALYCAPTHAPVIAALSRLLRSTGDFRRLAQVLERYADATPDTHRKVRARIRAAMVLELCLDDAAAASAAYTRALADLAAGTSDHAEADRHAALWGLLRLQEARSDWPAVEATLMRILETLTDRPARKRVLVRLARNRELRFNDVPRAQRLYEQAVAMGADPGAAIESSIAAMAVDRVRVARLEGKRETIATSVAAMAACTKDPRLESGLLRILALGNEHSGMGPRGRSKAAPLYERLIARDAEDPQALDGLIRCIASAPAGSTSTPPVSAASTGSGAYAAFTGPNAPPSAATPGPGRAAPYTPNGPLPNAPPSAATPGPGRAAPHTPNGPLPNAVPSAATPGPGRAAPSSGSLPAAEVSAPPASAAAAYAASVVPGAKAVLSAVPGAKSETYDARLSRALLARARATKDMSLRALLAFSAGVLDETQGRDDAAEAAYTAALAAEPELIPALDTARRLRQRAHDWAAVASLSERTARASLDSVNAAEAWLAAAAAYEEHLDDPGRALACYTALLASQPGHSRALEQALPLLEKSAEYQRAAAILSAYIDAIANDPPAQARWLARRAGILAGPLKDTSGAIGDLKRAIDLVPPGGSELLELLEKLAALEERARAWQEALLLHERIANLPSPEASRRARLAQARIHADELRDDAKAKEILETLVGKNAADREATFRLAEASRRTGHTVRARELYESISEGDAPAIDRGRALVALADLQSARADIPAKTASDAALSRAFDLAIADAAVIPVLVDRFTKGDPRGFVGHAEAAIGRAPSNAGGVLPLRMATARVLREKLGDPSAADRQLTAAIQAFPDSMATRIVLAKALIGRNDEEALAELRRAVAADPIAPGPFEMLGTLSRTTGRKDASVLLATAASLLGSTSEEVDATIRGLRPSPPHPNSLGPDVVGRIVGATRARFIRTLLPMLDPFLSKIFPGGETMLEARTPLEESDPLVADARAIAAALGCPAPAIYRGLGNEVLLLLTEPRAVVLGRDLLTDSARALANFYIACTCARIAAHGAVYAAPRQHVLALIEAAALPENDTNREFKKRLRSALPRKVKKDIERFVEPGVPDLHSEFGAWEAEEARRALYAGVVLGRDMRPVAQVLAADALAARADARRQALAGNARLREVLEFVASAPCWEAVKLAYGRT
jgi:tetratricopeptide (TPR) repeat protein